jgi:hypothetical protein
MKIKIEKEGNISNTKTLTAMSLLASKNSPKCTFVSNFSVPPQEESLEAPLHKICMDRKMKSKSPMVDLTFWWWYDEYNLIG